MERMTQKELEQLRALQAKQKRVQRAELEFFDEADRRKEELLSRWGIDIHSKKTKSVSNQPTVSAAEQPSVELSNFDLTGIFQPN